MSDIQNLPGAKVKVKFLESFKDGQIFGSKNFRVDEVAEITVDEYNKAKRSGAVMENMGVKLPEPDWGENAPPADEDELEGFGPSAAIDEPAPVVDLPADEPEPEPAPEPEPEPVSKEKKRRGGRGQPKA